MRSAAFRSSLTVMAVVGGFLGFPALLGWAEYSNWRAQVTRVETSLEQTAEAIVQHTDDVIELSRLPLASLIAEINDGAGGAGLPDRIRTLIAREMKASPTLGTLSYIDADGRLIASSDDDAPAGSSYAEQEYFQFHKSHPLQLPIVGKPIRSRTSQTWVIPISQKVTLADGSFAGVVVSSIRVNHFVNFFSKFDVGSDGTFLLVRGDGVVLARGPLQEDMLGMNMAGHELFAQHLKQRTVGAYHYRSPVDGTGRAGGFYQSERTGIVVVASAAEWQVFLAWAEAARARWIYAAVLVAVTLIAAVHWRGQTRLRRKSEALLAAREAEFRLLAESSSDVISRFDENGVREYVSPSSTEILGVEPERLIGRRVFDAMPEDSAATVRAAAERLRAGSMHEKFLTRHIKPNGEEVWLETALSKLPASRSQPATRVVAISRDVSRHKRIRDELNMLAHTDELTRLSNRRVFNARFEEMMQRARRSASPLTLLMIDADHFKLFNDSYGHAAGDDCLRQIAQVIRDCVRRPGDVAARYGGEELAILLQDTDESGAEAVAEAIRAKVEALGLPHGENPPMHRVTVSIGVATFSPLHSSSATAQDLFAEADDALYRAKTEGRNRVVTAEAPSRNATPQSVL